MKITSAAPLQGVPADRSQPREYWGYVVEERDIEQVLSDQRFRLKVATSRLGVPLAQCLENLRAQVNTSGSIMAVFGSPSRGLFDLVSDLSRRVEFVVNLYPEQQGARYARRRRSGLPRPVSPRSADRHLDQKTKV